MKGIIIGKVTDVSNTSKQRKERPVFTGVLRYFPDAIMEIAKVSLAGNKQHHPDKPLHWDREKSNDDLDALTRHLIDAGKIDSDGIRHTAKVAWRALAALQKEIELEELIQVKHTFKEINSANMSSLLEIKRDKSVTKVGYNCDKRVKSLSLIRAL